MGNECGRSESKIYGLWPCVYGMNCRGSHVASPPVICKNPVADLCGRAPHVGAPTKHGISCPIVGACTWQARYGYVNIMHADICVCFHALRVHHRFRQADLPGRPLRTRPMAVFFCGLHSFPSPVCDTVGDVLSKASRCESWV